MSLEDIKKMLGTHRWLKRLSPLKRIECPGFEPSLRITYFFLDIILAYRGDRRWFSQHTKVSSMCMCVLFFSLAWSQASVVDQDTVVSRCTCSTN